MKKVLSVLALVLIMLSACTQGRQEFFVPELLRGNWTDNSGQTLDMTADSAIYTVANGTRIDYSKMVKSNPDMYGVTYTDTLLIISSDTLGVTYEFEYSNGDLIFTMSTGGVSYPSVTYHK